MGTGSKVFILTLSEFYFIWLGAHVGSTKYILADDANSSRYKVENISACSAKIESFGTINLQPLERTDGYPRFHAVYKNPQDEYSPAYNYTFNPCSSFNEPKDPFAERTYGKKCYFVSVCKFNKDNNRLYSYIYGIQKSAKFMVINGLNGPVVALVFNGSGAMEKKKTVIMLKCNRTLRNVEDARFEILEDHGRLGIKAELSHICCCPNACVNGLPENTTDDGVASFATEEGNSVNPISSKLLTIVGVNVGVLILAGIVALMCYVKRSHLQIYYKLPGVQTTRGARYDVPSMDNLMENGLSGTTPGPVPRPVAYRDYEPEPSRSKKTIQLPVLEDCHISSNTITLGQRLGGGLFGDTHVGDYIGIKVAVTRITVNIHENQITPESRKIMMEEVWYLSRQRHRNIVSMMGICIENKLPYILSEFVEGESVKYYIQNRGVTVTWPQRMKICLQVADGMAYLHSTNPAILHRDLRCANLFISSHDIIKVGDFGLVKLIQPLRDICKIEECSCQGQYSACPSSIRWTAPEVLEHPTSKESESYITASSDVYSFGITMWELLMCEDPFDEIPTEQEVADLVKQGIRPEIPNSTSMMPQYKMLMKQCWNGEPENRPTFKQIATRSKELIQQSRNFQKGIFNKQRLQKMQQTIEIKQL